MTLLLLRYRLLIFLRLLRDRFFTLFVLAPLILGGFFYTVRPTVAMFREALRGSAGSFSFLEQLALAALGLAVWTAFFWPSAVREVAPTRSAAAYLDALPVPAAARFNVAFKTCFFRNAVCVVLLLAACAPEYLSSPAPYTFAASAAGLQLALVLLQRLYAKGAALALGLGLTLAAAALLPAFSGAAAAVLTCAAAASLTVGKYPPEPAAGSGRRAPRRAPRRSPALFRRPGETRPQLLRDLLLTGRFFSPAVFFAAAGAAVSLAAAWNVRHSAAAVRPAEMVLAGCALAALSLSALAPLLLRWQIPRFWLEQSSPVQADSLWKAKIGFALLISIPALLAAAAMLASLPGENFAVLAAQALLVVFSVASAVGMLTFETADRPLLGLTLAALLGFGLAGSYILFWAYLPWIGLLHAYVLHILADRARQTAVRIGGPPL